MSKINKNPQSLNNKDTNKEVLEAQNNPMHPSGGKILPYGG